MQSLCTYVMSKSMLVSKMHFASISRRQNHAVFNSSYETSIPSNALPLLSRKRNNETVRIDSVIQGRANGEVKILIIDGAARNHQGHYECIAKNPFGEASSEAKLTLQCKCLPPLVSRYSEHLFESDVS